MMTSEPEEADPIVALGRALAQAGAKLTIDQSRITRSTLHDANYHVAMIACAMNMYGDSGARHRVLAGWVKLLQFVAARPSLVENLKEYVNTRLKGDLEKWALMPRGYLGDQTHDGVVDFLVAADILAKNGDYLEGGMRFSELQLIAKKIEALGMFEAERGILNDLRKIKPSKVILGGT